MSLVQVQMFLLLMPWFLFLMASAVNIYIGYRDLSVVQDVFIKSWAVLYYGRCPPEKMRFLSRISLAFHLSGALAWPGRYIRNGELELDEFVLLPKSIQLRMRWASVFLLGGYVWLLVDFFVFISFAWV